MMKKNEEHMVRIMADFCTAYQKKYKAGQLEHGGNLWQKPGMLLNMQEEILDQWSYYHVIRQQLLEISDLCNKALTEKDAEKYITQISVRVWKLLSKERG